MHLVFNHGKGNIARQEKLIQSLKGAHTLGIMYLLILTYLLFTFSLEHFQLNLFILRVKILLYGTVSIRNY